ncbi:MAG: hypothetical protein MJY98_11535 [Fibrobacter sp.]|nr:hypothetical protein [Fibrobacter sp.]
MKKLAVLFMLFASLVFAEGFSWKTFDVKTGPFLAAYSNGYNATGIGAGLQLVKPFSPYIGVGGFYEIAGASTFSTDCDQYIFTDFSGGILLNMNVPISNYFSLTSNFMAGVTYRYGTYEESAGMRAEKVVVRDQYGNEVEGYPIYNTQEEDFEMKHIQFRANLGFSVHSRSQRFGAEVYVLDFASDAVVRHSFSINGTVRIF